jgi:glycosyltransferase involved in cell wall biosynthesis
MLNKPLVSVIVPIYKVEKYIRRCIDSIVNQTYTNLEIILVNDGSPDNCGEIVDHYSRKDYRIKAIHKENGGLSDARNYGMKVASGEFTIFVDSDDWIETDMIKNMVNHSLKYKADVVQSAFYYAYDDKLLIDSIYHPQDQSPEVLNNKRLMYELVTNEKVKNFAWGKLYRTNIICALPFEKGVLFEDVFWAHKVMHRVNTFLIIKQPYYNYYQRDDSIVATYSTRNLDIIKGLKERHRFIKKNYEELANESLKTLLRTCLIHYNLLLINKKKDVNGVHRKEIQNYVKEHSIEFKKAIEDDKQLKIQFMFFSMHPYLNVALLLVKKVLRKLKLTPQPFGLLQVEVRRS